MIQGPFSEKHSYIFYKAASSSGVFGSMISVIMGHDNMLFWCPVIWRQRWLDCKKYSNYQWVEHNLILPKIPLLFIKIRELFYEQDDVLLKWNNLRTQDIFGASKQ